MFRKAMTAALTLVITIVVLIVVALALITITTSNVGEVGGNAGQQQNDASCSIWKTTACAGKASGVEAKSNIEGCPACTCTGKSIKCP